MRPQPTAFAGYAGRMLRPSALLAFTLLATTLPAQTPAQLDGYLGVPNARAESTFSGGYSMYVAAWPLQATHPGPDFQTGLFGTWMHAEPITREPNQKQPYSDIEGGLGWWRDTRFPTTTPKFIMGGVALDFCAWANGPGAGKGRDWKNPSGKYAVAQLSPNVIWPPDGLDLAQGTSGQLFGYGYLPLPLTEPKATTDGKPVPTGNQCWTLFLATENFRGPVTFFLPYFFSAPSVARPELAGTFLDTRPADPSRALQMETQWIPAVTAQSDKGIAYARIAETRFPIGDGGDTALVHRISSYRRGTLFDEVKAWFDGGPECTGRIDEGAAFVHAIPGKGWSTWRIYGPEAERNAETEKGADEKAAREARELRKVAIDWASFATPQALDEHTFGYRFDGAIATVDRAAGLVTLPEFWRKEGEGKAARWKPVPVTDAAIPASLRDHVVRGRDAEVQEPYVTPADGCWKEPGPVAGPFEVRLGDGSTVVYSWYRFADQPALQNADLTSEERERMQKRVEMLHRAWKRDRDYLPPPKRGKLASLDPAVVVEPPKGMEVGFVPIVTWQGRK